MSEHVFDVTHPAGLLESIVQTEPLALVLVYSQSCLPCTQFMPVYERVAEKYRGKIKFTKLDLNKNPLAVEGYDIDGTPVTIDGTPTTLLFYNGSLKMDIIGMIREEHFEKFLKKKYMEFFNEELS